MLRRRLDFLETPAGFFYRDGEPQRAEEVPGPFHRGMLLIARATGDAEKRWLREAVAELEARSDPDRLEREGWLTQARSDAERLAAENLAGERCLVIRGPVHRGEPGEAKRGHERRGRRHGPSPSAMS
ncbi:hypothetical protein [Streptosporangium subroseum]|uniref:hypothetical protein n=1 Tax=Streptosporangium subroseum TaxID=106412 RepID=UPI0030903557|nr:hypothetical protein OHB15_06625 [Streptosporangium subroseum]